MAITINGSGTITGISAGGLPDGSVTAADIESSLDLSGKTVTLPSGTGGKVLQVVQSTATSVYSTTNSTPQDTGHSASITPSSSSNKILVIVSFSGYNTSAGRTYKAYLKRGATQIDGHHLGDDSTGTLAMSNSLVTLDSPSTTSSVTYTMFVGTDSVGTAYYNYSNAQGGDTITLMEIAG